MLILNMYHQKLTDALFHCCQGFKVTRVCETRYGLTCVMLARLGTVSHLLIYIKQLHSCSREYCFTHNPFLQILIDALEN